MGKKPFIILDEYLVGATTANAAYNDCKFDEVLAKFDRFSMAVLVDNVTASPSSLDIYIEHSPDGKHWLHKNGSADNPPGTGSGDVKWAAGALSATAPNPIKVGDSGAQPMFAFARLQILFGNSTTGAHIRITVRPHDSR